MRTISNKSEIQDLLEIESFRKVLQIENPLEMLDARRNTRDFYDDYLIKEDSEHGADGVVLFNTPQISNENDLSSYLQVIKLYGNSDLPFRVIGVTIWDEHEGISTPILSDVRTLSEALDYAFAGHALDTFDHAEIQSHLVSMSSSAPTPGYPVLQKHEAKTQATLAAQKARDARLAAPIRESDAEAVMTIAKANSKPLKELPPFDLAVQINSKLFGGKGDIFVVYTEEPDEETGLHGEVAVVGIQDNTGNYSYFDIDGVVKTDAQVIESYRQHVDELLHSEFPHIKEDGLSLLDFTDVLIRKMEHSEVKAQVDQELYHDDDEYSDSERIIDNAVHDFVTQREAAYQARLDRATGPSLES